MKNFLSVISSLILLLAFEARATKVVGQVVKIDGHAFLIRSGRVVEISKGTYIQDFDEVLTEDRAEIMLGDFSRRQLTLAGGGHLKWMNKLIELKRGYIWAQSLNQSELFVIQTANTQSAITQGEMVVSFDVSSSKTQVLSLSGLVQASSLLSATMYDLKQGQFTMVQKEHDEGIPRRPTSIGMDSLKKMRSLFSLTKPLGKMDDKTFLATSTQIHSGDRAPAEGGGEGDYELPEALDPEVLADPVPKVESHHADGGHGHLTHEASHETHHGPAHEAGHESAHEAGHESAHEASHEPTHETSHEPAHEAGHEPAHEASHEPAHEAGHEPAHEASHESAHEASHEPAHETSHEPIHKSSHEVTHELAHESTLPTHHNDHSEHDVHDGHDEHNELQQLAEGIHHLGPSKTTAATLAPAPPGEIRVISKEVLPEKQPDAFELNAQYDKELKELEKQKAQRLRKNQPRAQPVKVRIFGLSAASGIRGPSSLPPSPAQADPTLSKLKTQIRLSEERKNLLQKLQTMPTSAEAESLAE